MKYSSIHSFIFLPIFLAFTSAKKFDYNPFLALSIAGILLHPAFTAMVANSEAVDFFEMNLPLITYLSSVLLIILTICCMSYVEHFIHRYLPNALKLYLVPALTLLIVAPIALMVFGPLGNIMGGWLSAGITFKDYKASWLVVTLMAISSGVTALMGIKPARYGATLPLKKPLITVMFAGKLAAFPVFIDHTADNANIINFVICCIIGFVEAFLLTLILGFEDVKNKETVPSSSEERKDKLIHKISIYAPTEGDGNCS